MTKANLQPLTNRHDILFLFEVTNGNPNGDPDAGNMPRLDPNTNHGIVTDVCLKRKVRDYVSTFPPLPDSNPLKYEIFVQQSSVLNSHIQKAVEEAGEATTKKDHGESAVKWLCETFYDIRTFGAVLSTGHLKGSAWGQVRGPVQFTFGQSFHPITPLEITITRCAVTDVKDIDKQRTMGNKHIVPYALYAARAYVSPAFAKRSGFTQADLEVFFEALVHMFDHDHSAARGDMVVRGVYDFEHVGTQHPNNAQQNTREAELGCAHAHHLFEGVSVKLKENVSFPKSFDDYTVNCTWDQTELPKGVVLHKRHTAQKALLRSA
ncbi:MAG: type I-C CRISPR-associated protein Cas7/Csd2 [Proteobacteria bacterium]|nr:type I-C CRISPR-associated protein Cas7/Csd2 [Pseudomonadota bacterium]